MESWIEREKSIFFSDMIVMIVCRYFKRYSYETEFRLERKFDVLSQSAEIVIIDFALENKLDSNINILRIVAIETYSHEL